MNLLALLMLGGVIAVPCAALGALFWASRNGEFRLTRRAALLPFDEDEPVGRPTDQILNREGASR